MSMEGWQTIALTLDYPHHASGSGYGQLARVISYDAVITPPSGPVARIYDGFVRRTSSSRLIKKFTRRRTATEIRYFLRLGLKAKKRIVHAFYGEHHSWLLRTLRKGRREKRVMTIHLPPSLWHVSFKPGQVDNFDAIILMSHSQIEPLRDGLGYKGRIEVIEHGVDIDRFAFVQRIPDPKKVRCIMVGNFLRDYGALAEIARYCLKNAPEIHFDVVANMKAAVPIVGLENVTHHCGISDEDLVKLYQEATLGLFTLEDCTANNAVLEAMSTGLPIVGNEVGGIDTYVLDNKDLLGDITDPAAVVERIREALNNYEARSKKARENAEQFAWSKIGQRTLELYAEVAHAK